MLRSQRRHTPDSLVSQGILFEMAIPLRNGNRRRTTVSLFIRLQPKSPVLMSNHGSNSVTDLERRGLELSIWIREHKLKERLPQISEQGSELQILIFLLGLARTQWSEFGQITSCVSLTSMRPKTTEQQTPLRHFCVCSISGLCG